jgi:hypothetical protein
MGERPDVRKQKGKLGGRTINCSTREGGKVKRVRIVMVNFMMQEKTETQEKTPYSVTTKCSVFWENFWCYSLGAQSCYWHISGSSDVVSLGDWVESSSWSFCPQD